MADKSLISSKYCRTSVAFVVVLKRLVVMVTLMLPCVLAACAPSMTQRIKVTVTVEDNGTLYTGSAVQQWTCTGDKYIGDKFISTGACRLNAEAIPIKIGNKGWVFMLLSGNPASGVIADYYPFAIQEGRSRNDATKPWTVPLNKAPLFVRFRDTKDLMTLEKVDTSHFDQAFGDGVRLISIDCANTKGPLTRGNVKQILPWLKKIGPGSLTNMTKDYSNFVTFLNGENFELGID